MSKKEQAAPTIGASPGSVKLEPFPGRVRDDGVVVLPDEAPEMTKGGIIRPETHRLRPRTGVVVALGPGKRDEQGKVEPSGLSIGDHVLYGRYAGEEIAVLYRGRECSLLRFHEVRVVLDPGAEVDYQ